MQVQQLSLYTYRTFLDSSSREYVAECLEIPGLSGIGETEQEALAELKDAVAGWLEVLEEDKLSPPQPLWDSQNNVVFIDSSFSFNATAGNGSGPSEATYPSIRIESAERDSEPNLGTNLSS